MVRHTSLGAGCVRLKVDFDYKNAIASFSISFSASICSNQIIMRFVSSEFLETLGKYQKARRKPETKKNHEPSNGRISRAKQ